MLREILRVLACQARTNYLGTIPSPANYPLQGPTLLVGPEEIKLIAEKDRW